MNMKIACVAGLLLAGVAASHADAALYTWTITGPGTFNGSGQFTTQDTPTAPPDDVADTNIGLAYLLTSFTGTFANKTVQLVPWNPDEGPWYADNLFYPEGHFPYVDLDGILFETLKANGQVAQIYNMFDSLTCNSHGCTDKALIGYPGIGTSKNVTFSFTTIIPVPPPAVPEPATWAMMIGGLGMVGAAMRRKRAAIRTA